MAAPSDQTKEACKQKWMALQQQELSELTNAITSRSTHAELSQLIGKIMTHFQDYADKSALLARANVWSFFAPSSLERAFHWIGGCRPSHYIDMIYALPGPQIESLLANFLAGQRIGALGYVTGQQLTMATDLKRRTIVEERKLSDRLASLQELLNNPIAAVSTGCGAAASGSRMEAAVDEHGRAMAGVLEEADQLRLATLKEVMKILTPPQAVEYLAVIKRYDLAMHAGMGRKRNLDHRRN